MAGINKEWEYLRTEFQSEARMDHLGKQGWELVSVCVQFTGHFMYFKRPLPPVST